MADITDQERKARSDRKHREAWDWALKNPDNPAAKYVLANMEPPKKPSLSDELRQWAREYLSESLEDDLNRLVGRVEEIEQDRDRLFSITQKVELERDSAIAEAKHLTAAHDRENRIIDRAEDLDALLIGAAFRVRDDVAVVSDDGRFHFPGTGLKITGGAEAFRYANYVGGTIRVLFEPAADEA